MALGKSSTEKLNARYDLLVQELTRRNFPAPALTATTLVYQGRQAVIDRLTMLLAEIEHQIGVAEADKQSMDTAWASLQPHRPAQLELDLRDQVLLRRLKLAA